MFVIMGTRKVVFGSNTVVCRYVAKRSPQPLPSTHPSRILISCEGEYYTYIISWQKLIYFEIKEVRGWRKEHSSALWSG